MTVPGAARLPPPRRSSRLVLLAACVSLATSCQRSAPSPGECLGLALTWHRIGSNEWSMLGGHLPPQLEVSVQQLTLRCLTQPFSRRVVECVQQLGPSSACLAVEEQRPARM